MPASYKPPTRGDQKGQQTYSQTASSNLASGSATVADLMAKKDGGIVSIGPGDTLSQAVQILKDKRIGALVVTDGDGALKGILSERDIVRKLADTPGQTLPQSVADNMTATVQTCSSGDSLVSVLRTMTDGRFRHMPVMDGAAVVGMITIGDVVNFRLAELEYEAVRLKQMIVG